MIQLYKYVDIIKVKKIVVAVLADEFYFHKLTYIAFLSKREVPCFRSPLTPLEKGGTGSPP
ncbi:hypothetical protein AFK68_28015 [Hydrocoleum sp. CS-953]|nr:hypothetical protein AFK68_28015 [Hydrocoleum sp. CS-953]